MQHARLCKHGKDCPTCAKLLYANFASPHTSVECGHVFQTLRSQLRGSCVALNNMYTAISLASGASTDTKNAHENQNAPPEIDTGLRACRERSTYDNAPPEIDTAHAEIDNAPPEIDAARAEIDNAPPEIDIARAEIDKTTTPPPDIDVFV